MPPLRLALYAATGAELVMVGYALLVRPFPLAPAVLGLVAYATLALGGVLHLGWRVFVDAVVRGPKGAHGVALTFDDGPHPRWTPRILDILEGRGVRATFFLIGRKAEEHPEVVRALLRRGHAVGLHSYCHDRLFALRRERTVRDDLERGIAALQRVTGRRPTLFRPPIGHTNPIIARVADALALVVVGWTASGWDGLRLSRPAGVAARVKRKLRDGAIVALHDAPEKGDYEPAAVRALPAILEAISDAHLEVVTLASWIDGG